MASFTGYQVTEEPRYGSIIAPQSPDTLFSERLRRSLLETFGRACAVLQIGTFPCIYMRMPGAGYFAQTSLTSAAVLASTLASLGAAVTLSIHSAMRSITSVPIPRLVVAGVPMRTPDGSNGLRGSNGMAL